MGKSGGLDKLKIDLNTGFFRRLYVFYGIESYLREHYTKQLINAVVKENMQAFDLRALDGASLDAQELMDAVDTMPMGGGGCVVTVRDLDFGKCQPAVKTLFESGVDWIPEYSTVILIYSALEYKPDARLKLYKSIAGHALRVEFEQQPMESILPWIARRFAALGKQIDASAARHMADTCGTLMANLAGECEKVASYASGSRITVEDINAVVVPSSETVVFWLADAVAERRYARALEILADLNRAQEKPEVLISLISRQIRILGMVRFALDENKTSAQIAEICELRPGFITEKYIKLAKKTTAKWCMSAFKLCASADMELKSSVGDRDRVIELLIMRLAAL